MLVRGVVVAQLALYAKAPRPDSPVPGKGHTVVEPTCDIDCIVRTMTREHVQNVRGQPSAKKKTKTKKKKKKKKKKSQGSCLCPYHGASPDGLDRN